MKQCLTKLSAVAVLIILFGCARQDDVNEVFSSNPESHLSSNNTGKISEAEAVDLAFSFIVGNAKSTRSASNVSVDYIFSNDARTRSVQNDTLAYVINVPDEGGYAIISRTASEDDVVAFSHEGNFDVASVETKWVVENLLVPYLERASDSENTRSASKIVGGHTLYDGMELISPKASYGIHQDSPYNDVITQYYPGCVAGCVPVAIANIAITAKRDITINEEKFYLESIRKGFFTHLTGIQRPEIDLFPVIPPITGTLGVVGYNPVFTYEAAVTETAKLLFRLGQALKTTYRAYDENLSGPASGTTVPNTQAFLDKYGFSISVPLTYSTLNEQMVVNRLRDNTIFFMLGYDQTRPDIAHAYVCDGCYYLSSSSDDSIIEKSYLHIDWGWRSGSTGYYNGKVWSAGGYDFITYGLIGIDIEK